MALTKEHFDKSLKLWKEESNSYIDKMRDELKNTFSVKCEENKEKVQQLMNTVSEQAKQIVRLETDIKKRNVIFHNIPENEGSVNQLKANLTEIIKNEVDSNFTAANIDYCHRIGRASEQKLRPIVLALTTVSMKENLMRNKKTLGNKNISISEDLPTTIRNRRKEIQPLTSYLIAKGNKVILKGSSLVVNGVKWSENKVEEELNSIKEDTEVIGENTSSVNKRVRSPESSNEISKQAKINVNTSALTSIMTNVGISGVDAK